MCKPYEFRSKISRQRCLFSSTHLLLQAFFCKPKDLAAASAEPCKARPPPGKHACQEGSARARTWGNTLCTSTLKEAFPSPFPRVSQLSMHGARVSSAINTSMRSSKLKHLLRASSTPLQQPGQQCVNVLVSQEQLKNSKTSRASADSCNTTSDLHAPPLT